MGLAPPCTPVMTPAAAHQVRASRDQSGTSWVSPQELKAVLGGLEVLTPAHLAKRHTMQASSSRLTCLSGRNRPASGPLV